MLVLFSLLPADPGAAGTGNEWLIYASLLVPALLLIILLYVGSRRTY